MTASRLPNSRVAHDNLAVARSEHISLEGDSEERAAPNLEQTLTQFDLGKAQRGITTRVSILRDDYVLIETCAARGAIERHTVDLRFVDPRPMAVRKVARTFLRIALACFGLATIGGVLYVYWPGVLRPIGGVLVPILFALSALGSLFAAYRLTSEALLFFSAHGRARVINIRGRWGTARRAQASAAEIVRRIRAASRRLNQTRQMYLRDEMREHTRLRDQGILSEDQYLRARTLILKAHK